MSKSKTLIVAGICLILCGVLIPPAAYVACYFMPREYTSEAVIEVKSNEEVIIIFSTEDDTRGVDPHFIADQIQILQSKAILYPVIDELKLVDKWSASLPAKLSRDEAYQKLLKMLRVSRKENTGKLLIAVISPDKQEAADLANAITDTYQKRRRDDLEQQIANALSELNAEVDKQRQNMEAERADLEKIRTRDNVQDPNPDNTATPVTPPNPEYEAAKQKYLDAKKILDRAEVKYQADKMELQIELVPAETWDRAEPAKGPSSPDVPHIMNVATGIAVLWVVCGGALIFMGVRAKREEAAAKLNPAPGEVPPQQ